MKSKKLTLICSIGLILVLLTSLVLAACAKEEAPAAPAAPAKPEVYHWKFQSVDPPDTVGYNAEVSVFENLYAITGGRLDIEIFGAGQLVKGPDLLDGLAANTIQAANAYGGYYKGFMPEGAIDAGFPMQYRNYFEAWAVYYDLGLIDLIREAWAEQGAYYMSCADYGPLPIWATKPIRSMEDFKGLKIRAVGDMSTMLERMGAAPVYIPHEEGYMALQLGTVDAYSTGFDCWYSYKHYEMCKYVMSPPVLPTAIANCSLSLIALAELPEDLQTILKNYGVHAAAQYTRYRREKVDYIIQDMPNVGAEFVEMDADVVQYMTDAGVGFLDEYAAQGGRLAKMVDIIKGYMKSKGYIQ